MALTFGIKYLLSVIGVFSRKIMVYWIYNKKPENLILYLARNNHYDFKFSLFEKKYKSHFSEYRYLHKNNPNAKQK